MNDLFVFVILHYITAEDTFECVESILENVDYDNYKIIIVDNGSPDNSGETITKRYNNHPKINIIISEDNLGFAKGNNLGFNYAKYKFNADFIALINNDTLIKQSDFISSIISEYNLQTFHILGPDIVSTKDEGHQNPAKIIFKSKDELEILLKFYRIKYLLSYLFLDQIIERIKKRIFKKKWIKTGISTSQSYHKKQYNIKLHGSALIFSKNYSDKYDGLYDKTFMHGEESILYYITQRDELKTVFLPSVKILHKEDSATNIVYNKNYKKRRFYYKSFVKSGKILLDLMNKSEGNYEQN